MDPEGDHPSPFRCVFLTDSQDGEAVVKVSFLPEASGLQAFDKLQCLVEPGPGWGRSSGKLSGAQWEMFASSKILPNQAVHGRGTSVHWDSI